MNMSAIFCGLYTIQWMCSQGVIATIALNPRLFLSSNKDIAVGIAWCELTSKKALTWCKLHFFTINNWLRGIQYDYDIKSLIVK